MLFKTIDTGNGNKQLTTWFGARKTAQETATKQLETDVECLKAYEAECQKGSVDSSVFARTMQNASVAAKEYAVRIKEGTGSANDFRITQEATSESLKKVSLSTKIASGTLGILKTALNSLLIGIAVAAITKIGEELLNLSKSAKIASDEAQKAYEDAKEAYETKKEESKSLDELIKKYQELKSLNKNDAETREQIKNIQGDIVSIVGEHVDGIDLVNGELETQLGIIKQIVEEEQKRNVTNASTAYHAAKTAENTAVGEADDYGNDVSYSWENIANELGYTNRGIGQYDGTGQILGYYKKGSNEFITRQQIIDVFKKAGFNDIVRNAYTFSKDIVVDTKDIDGIENKISRLKELRDYLFEIGWKNTNLFVKVNGAIESYNSKLDNTAETSLDLLESTIEELIKSSEELKKIPVDSSKDLINYREQLIDEVKNSDDISDLITDGDWDNSKIVKYVDQYISTLECFEDFYDGFTKRVQFEDRFPELKQNDFSNKEIDALLSSNSLDLQRFISQQKRSYDVGRESVEEYNKSIEENIKNAHNKTVEAKKALEDEYKKIDDYGLSKYSDAIKNNTIQTTFGNIDMDKRTIIKWSDELKETYKKELESWDYNPEIGSIDTVFGGSFDYDIGNKNYRVQFSQILPDGTLLSEDTVDQYIQKILEQAFESGDFSQKSVLKLDKEGFKIGETYVSGIIAGMSDTSKKSKVDDYGALMHFSGKYDAVQLAKQEIIKSQSNEVSSHKELKKAVDETTDSYRKFAQSIIEQNINSDNVTFFKDVWKQLKKEAEDSKSEFKDVRDSLTKLADQGRLTDETFKKTKGALSYFEQFGISADEAVKKINKLSGAAKQLDAMSGAFTPIGEALYTKKKEKFVDVSTLSDMNEEMQKLPEFDEFFKVMASSKSSMEEAKKASDNLATAWLYQSGYLENLTEDTKDAYITQMKQMGISNAAEVANSYLTTSVKALELETLWAKEKTEDLTTATLDECIAFAKEKGYTEQAGAALKLLALDKLTVNGAYLDFGADCTNLANFVKSVGVACSALNTLAEAKNGKHVTIPGMGSEWNHYIASQKSAAEKEVESAYDKLNEAAHTQVSVSTAPINPSGSSGKDKKNKGSGSNSDTQNTKQTIDWIERRLNRLQKTIDKTKAKFDNLFSIKDKHKNLEKQIKQYAKLMNAQSKAANKYAAQAESVTPYTKKESKKLKGKKRKKALAENAEFESLKKLVREGKIDGDIKTLIAEYGEKTAEAISKYKEYYDKSVDLAISAEGTKKTIRETKAQNIQLDIDELDKKIQTLEAKQENAKNAKQANKIEDQLIKLRNEKANQEKKLANLNAGIEFSGKNFLKEFKKETASISKTIKEESEKNEKALTDAKKKIKSAKKSLADEYSKMDEWGLGKYKKKIKSGKLQTVFGNIDMNDRTAIKWNKKTKKKYADELKSWGYDPKNGSTDSTFGKSSDYNVEDKTYRVQFSPILPDGTLLSKETVEQYIQEIIKQAFESGDFSQKSVLKLDKEGFKIGETYISGIIAGMSDASKKSKIDDYAKLMDFSGAIGLAESDLKAGKKAKKDAKKAKKSSGSFAGNVLKASMSAAVKLMKKQSEEAKKIEEANKKREAEDNARKAERNASQAGAAADKYAAMIENEFDPEKRKELRAKERAKRKKQRKQEAEAKRLLGGKENKLEAAKIDQERIKEERESLNQDNQDMADWYSARAEVIQKQIENISSATEKNKLEDQYLDQINKKYEEEYAIAVRNNDLAQQRSIIEERIKESRESVLRKFNNIKDEYDNEISLITARKDNIEKGVSLAEASGKGITSKFYSQQIDLNNQSLAQKKKERKELIDQMNNMVIKSEQWYQAADAVHTLDGEILDLTQSNSELSRSIDELDWSNFDELRNLLHDVTDEASFLVDLLSSKQLFDDNGKIQSEGLAAMGLHAYSYDMSMAESDKIAKEIKLLDAKFAGDKNNKSYIDRRKELVKAQQEAIKNAQSEKNSVIDLVKNGLDLELSSLKDVIDAKKEALDLEKETYEYNKKVSSQKKNIAKIEKQLKVLEGDTSDEAKKKKRELKASLEDAKEELSDTIYDKKISDSKKELDDMYIKAQKKNEEYLKDTDKVFSDAIDKINANQESVSEAIKTTASDVGYTVRTEITDAWTTAGDAVGLYCENFELESLGVCSGIKSIGSAWSDALSSYATYAETTLASLKELQDEIERTGIKMSSLSTEGIGSSTSSTSDFSATLEKAAMEDKIKESLASAAASVSTSDTSSTSSSTTSTGIGYDDFSKTLAVAAMKDEAERKVSSLTTGVIGMTVDMLAGKDVMWANKIFDSKKFTGDKNKLDDSNLIDRLKKHDFASGFEKRKKYYEKLGGSGTYTGSEKQDKYIMKLMKEHGYASGTKSATPGYHYYDEKGIGSEVIFTKAGLMKQFEGGERVFNKDMTDNLWNLAKMNLSPMPIPTSLLERNNQPINIDSSIHVDGVATDVIVGQMAKVAEQQTKNVITQINRNCYSMGVRKY